MSAPEPDPDPTTGTGSGSGRWSGGSIPRRGRTVANRYLVIETLGQGGMGIVVRGYDPKLCREVALKLVRPDAGSTGVQARLVHEAQAMAQLNHPNVVQVYDVETHADHFVIAMEFVAGQSLRSWLDTARRDWREIRGAFVLAGRGLSAAHDRGLLHRDFKPANVLCTETADGRIGSVKVTDFGLARMTEPAPGSPLPHGRQARSENAELVTQAGMTYGTPRYMAPEQHRATVLSPATDQYAFCIALWEALAGKPPFSGEAIAAQKMAGPPAWPTGVTVPRSIIAAIRRGLSPVPADRWPNLDVLLDALSSNPGTRRRRWVAVAAALGGVGLGGAGWQTWANSSAEPCTGARAQLRDVWNDDRRDGIRNAMSRTGMPSAEATWRGAVRDLDRYAEAWTTTHTEVCTATTVDGLQPIEVMTLRMTCLHRARSHLQAAVGVLADADDQVVHKAHAVVGGLPALERCSQVDALQAKVEPPPPSEAEAVERARTLLADITPLRNAGRYQVARAKIAEAEETLVGVDYPAIRAELELQRGNILAELGEYDRSAQTLRLVMTEGPRQGQWTEVADAATLLVFVVGYRQGHHAAGRRYASIARALYRRSGDVLDEARVRHSEGLVLMDQGLYDAAAQELERATKLREDALGPSHTDVAMSRNALGNLLTAQGKYQEAEQEHRASLGIWETHLGPKHPSVGSAHNNLGNALFDQGRYEASEREHRLALKISEAILGPDHPTVATSHNNLGNALYAQGEYDDAIAEHRIALRTREQVYGRDHAQVGSSHTNLGSILYAQGKFAEAEAEYRTALTIRERAHGHEHPMVASLLHNLGSALSMQGRDDSAATYYRSALRLRRKLLAAGHPDLAQSEHVLAEVLYDSGDAEAARPLLEEAWRSRQRTDIPPRDRAKTAFLLAQVSWTAGDRPRALSLAERASKAYAQADDETSEAEVRAWLRARSQEEG